MVETRGRSLARSTLHNAYFDVRKNTEREDVSFQELVQDSGRFPPGAKVDPKRVVAPSCAIAIEGRAKIMNESSAKEVFFERVEEAR